MNTARDCGRRIRLLRCMASVALGMVLIHQLSAHGRDQTGQRDGGTCAILFASKSSGVSVSETARAQAGIAGRALKPATSPGWRLPDSSPVSHKRGWLVNYFHMDLPDSHVGHVSERLAQWDVVILNHDLVEAGRVSIDRMRRTNPRVKILAWVPLQGPNNGMMKGVPKKSGRDWYARKTDGSYLVPHWGGNLMNPCAQDAAWMRHVLRYARDVCLASGRYDGLMLDCLWHQPPAGLDVNGDKVFDRRDEAEWQEAMLFLLRELRAAFPKTILVGNGGLPWPLESRYYDFVNGCMHENALGDEFGGDWNVLWTSYKMAAS
ncbi:MAG: putative glycoside hydrolase, partial [Verrucomicrobiia bacterium]